MEITAPPVSWCKPGAVPLGVQRHAALAALIACVHGARWITAQWAAEYLCIPPGDV